MQGTDFMDDNNSMKSYGLFNMLRGLLRYVTALIGGVFAKSFSVGVSYTFLCVYPTFMIIFTLFFFKETSVKLLDLYTYGARKESGLTAFG